MSQRTTPPEEHHPPTAKALAAAVRLLADGDPEVAGAAREWLQRCGEAAGEALAAGAEDADPRLRSRARGLLRLLEVRAILGRLGDLDLGPGNARRAMPLLQGAVLVGQMVRPFAPAAGELKAWLRGEAELLRRRFEGRSLAARARLLAERLHDQLGFRGEAMRQGGPLPLDHVLLHRVLAGSEGAAVTLCLIYLMAGRRAGLAMAGVALPGCFLVRIHGPRPVLVDPVRGGRTVTKADCVRFLRAKGHDRVQHHLRDLTDREMLVHYLRGLRRAAAESAEPNVRATLGHALAALESR